MSRRFVWVGLCILAVSGIAGARSSALQEIDKQSERSMQAPRDLSPAERKLVKPGKAIQYEERLGVPTFLWAAPSSAAETKARAARVSSAAKPDVAGEARRHAAAYASFYGLQKGDIASASVVDVHDTGSGAIIVKFQEDVGGIEVFREGLSVMMDRNLDPIALSGYLSGAPRQLAASAVSFRLDERAAVATAFADRTGMEISPRDLVTAGQKRGPYGFVDQSPRVKTQSQQAVAPDSLARAVLSEPARYKQVYFHTADGFEPAYYVEINAELTDFEGNIDNDMYSYVISATDGSILYRHDLTVSDAFTYRLWADTAGGSVNFPSDSPNGDVTTPHPTGNSDGSVPPYIASSLHTLQAYPFLHSATDPWLPSTATETVGNNIDAYLDRFGGDGYQPGAGDFRAPLSSPDTFDYTFDPTVDALANTTQQNAAIASLFYIDNFLHDFFYDAGFDEAAGNAQFDNYGRGGIGGDTIRAEAQDGSGTNNANMSTPADGGRPRQQMYIWSGPQNETITVNSQPVGGTLPPSYNPFQIGAANFGFQVFDLTADVVRVDDGVGAGAAVNDGCEVPFVTPVTGKIAFIDRGTCGFAIKAANAAGQGAVGVIIANVSSSGTPALAPNMGTANPPCPAQPGNPLGGCTIGALSLNFADGQAWRSTLAAGTVNTRLKRDIVVQRDGSLDAPIVSHEWGHYLSNRNIHNASGLGNQQGGGMGEGWSDFVALLTTVREEDTSVPSNATWNGVYPTGPYADVASSTDPYYFGVRRVPYSTDMTKDPLTFQHIANGSTIAPPFAGPFNPNGFPPSEVHNTGEIWATMLWECFASLLNHHPFAEARIRMRDYLVASLKMTPANPTFTEARDAVLAAAIAADPADHALFCAAFAKRGAGTFAVSPDRFSTTNTPVVESFECASFMTFQSASLSAPTDSCDTDSYLDNTEVGTLTVTFKNVGGATLSHTTANISSANPNVYFSNGGVMTFPAVAPFQTTTATISVSMFGASGIQDFYIDIAGHDSDISAPIPVAHLDVRGNANDVANSSSSDDVEARLTPWVSAGNTNGTWVRQQLLPAPPALPPPPFSYAWHSPDQGDVSDIRLASPAVHVGAGGATFSFKHRYSFEATFDGGVVETSINGGTTWVDIGAANLSPTYAAAALVAGSPLAGRMAYTGNSAGYPALVTVTGTLGPSFAGLDVMIRFRAASDGGVGATGWDVDDIVFSNITNTPFSTVVAQPANPAVEALSPAHAWLGVQKGNEVGTNFDMLAEVFRNGVLIGSGELDNITGGSNGWKGAKDRVIALALSSPGASGACSGDTISIKLSVRVTAVGGHNSGTARLWYNDSQANTRFGVTIAGVPSNLYLLNGFVLGSSPGANRLTIDVFVDRTVGGNPWKPFGTWIKTF